MIYGFFQAKDCFKSRSLKRMSKPFKKEKSNTIAISLAILGVVVVVMIIFMISMNAKIAKLSNELSGDADQNTKKQQVPSTNTPNDDLSLTIKSQDYVKGDENAPVTIFEFSEFQCPFCVKFYNEAYQNIIKDYVETGKVKIVFKHFPLAFHQNAQKAGEAAECAGEQGMFWEYHDFLFETKQIELSSLKAHAADLGLDTQKFNACLDSGKYTSVVNKGLELGKKQGVSGTPTFFINGKKIIGAQPYSVFKTEIDAALSS